MSAVWIALSCAKGPPTAPSVGPEAVAAAYLGALVAGDTRAAAEWVDPHAWYWSQAATLAFQAYVAHEQGQIDHAPEGIEDRLQTDPEGVQRMAVAPFAVDLDPDQGASLRTAGCRVSGEGQRSDAVSPRPTDGRPDPLADVRQVALVPVACGAPRIVVGSQEHGVFAPVEGVVMVQRGEPAVWRAVTLHPAGNPAAFPTIHELVTHERSRQQQQARQTADRAALQAAHPPRFEPAPSLRPEIPPPTTPPPVPQPGDLDGDGLADVVLATHGAARVRVWTRRDPAPTHTIRDDDDDRVAVGRGTLVADLDGDGGNELVLLVDPPGGGTDHPEGLWVVPGTDLGGAPVRHPLEVNARVTPSRRLMAPGDLDGDGRIDLTFPGDRDTLHLWRGAPLAALGALVGQRDGGLGAAAVGHTWPDGTHTLVVGEPRVVHEHGIVWILHRRGATRLSAGQLAGTRAGIELGRALARGDFDGDGGPEIAIGAPGEGGSIWVGDLSPDAIEPTLTLTAAAGERLLGHQLGAADLDGDGYDDLVAAGMGGDPDDGGFARIYWGAPAGLAAERETTHRGVHGFTIPGDTDGDGALELVLTRNLHRREGEAHLWRFADDRDPAAPMHALEVADR